MCLNRACRATFHSFERESPECPRCGCARVSWVPGGGHIGTTGNIDRTVRSLAESYGMTNVNTPSPSRLNRAMPKHYHPPADGPTVNFGGFSAPVNSRGMSTASWAQTNITSRQSVAIDQPLPSSAPGWPNISRSGLGLPGNRFPRGYQTPQQALNPIARAGGDKQ
jgi:hypothetical protein